MRRFLFALSLAALVMLPAAREGRAETQTPRKGAKWLLLCYFNMDCNLELQGWCQLDQGIMQATHSEDVTVIVQADRHAKDGPESSNYTGRGLGDTIENWHGAKRLKFSADGVEELEDLGETNNGDPNVASDFFAWGLKNYPADKVALIFFDHGAGWVGWGGDEGNNHDGLRVSELGKALGDARQKAGREAPFDVVIFESCLMSSLEVARAVAPHAKYLAGSEEISYVGGGVYWKNFLTALSADPTIDELGLAKLFCDKWRGFFDNHRQENIKEMGRSFPLHVLDLSKVAPVVAATDAFSEGLIEVMKAKGRDAFLKIAGSRNRAEEYGRMGNDTYHCRDLYMFADGCKGLGIDAQREQLMRAIKACNVYQIDAEKRPGAKGISVCFAGTPAEYANFVKRIVRDYDKHGASPKWPAMLDLYYKLAAEDTSSPVVKINIKGTMDLKIGQQAKFPTSLENDADVADAYFFLGMPQGNSYIVIGQYPVPLSDIRNGVVEYDGTWLAFGNDRMLLWACIISYDEINNRSYMVGIPVKYKGPGGDEEKDITLFFTVSFDENWKFTTGKFMYAYVFSENGPAPIQLRPGGQIKGTYLVITDKGLQRWPSKEVITLDKKLLSIKELAMKPGEYVAGYRLRDFSGNEVTEYVKVKLVK